MNRDILKSPTLCGAKNSNNVHVPSHLVTWIPHTERTGPRYADVHADVDLDIGG